MLDRRQWDLANTSLEMNVVRLTDRWPKGKRFDGQTRGRTTQDSAGVRIRRHDLTVRRPSNSILAGGSSTSPPLSRSSIISAEHLEFIVDSRNHR